FDFANLFTQTGKLRYIGESLEMLPQWPRGYTPDGFSRADPLSGENSAFAADDRFRIDLGFFSNTGLTADHGVVSDCDAAGKTSLRSDHYVSADIAVVRDVNQIVQLGALTNARDSEGSAVYATVRANLHVVFDFDSSDLRKFFIAIIGKREAEAIRA